MWSTICSTTGEGEVIAPIWATCMHTHTVQVWILQHAHTVIQSQFRVNLPYHKHLESIYHITHTHTHTHTHTSTYMHARILYGQNPSPSSTRPFSHGIRMYTIYNRLACPQNLLKQLKADAHTEIERR